MYRLFPFLYAFIAFLFINGCNTNQKVDRQAVREEMKARELKKISKAEITEKGLELGNAIATQAQQTLQKNLLRAMNEKGVPGAISYCNANALDLVQELEDSLDVKIFRVSSKYRNPVDEPDSLETLILEAYEYNKENDLVLESSIQEESDEILLYTKPISINNPLCLQCHGKIGEELSSENYDVISGYYPEDKAHGYELEQLRGMWSIRIPKKTIVNSL